MIKWHYGLLTTFKGAALLKQTLTFCSQWRCFDKKGKISRIQPVYNVTDLKQHMHNMLS